MEEKEEIEESILVPKNGFVYFSWNTIITTVCAKPPRTDIKIPKHNIERPDVVGMEKIVGMPKPGKIRDFGVSLLDKGRVHIEEYKNYFKVHRDEEDPKENPIGHLIIDAGKYLLLAIILLGVGYLIYNYLKNN